MSTLTTVLGRIDSGSLETVLAAETLLCAPADDPGPRGRPATDAAFERAPVTMERLGRLMLGAENRDDRTLEGADAEAALDGLAATVSHRALSGDVSHGALSGNGRPVPRPAAAVVVLAERGSTATPALLAALSRASGVALVRGVDGSQGPHGAACGAAPELVAERIAAALSAAEHAAGAVGALPLPCADPVADPADAARIEAAAGAARAAGAALVLAPRGDPWSVAIADEPGRGSLLRALAAVDAAGLERGRVILGGAAACIARRDDRGAPLAGVDPARLDALLALGTAICFDDLGRIPNVRTVVSDHDVALAVLRAAERGDASRILLSSGIRNKHRLTAYGGTGLEFVPERFLPYLRGLGADDALLRAVGGANAAGVLARATTEQAS